MTANLTISALAAIGTAGVVPVSVELTDGTGSPVVGFTSTGPVVLPSSTVTNSSGEVTLALEPNANITPANTYYVVKVADRRFLIEKSASTQTLQAAVAEIIEDLGMATALLRTNNLSDLANAATARTNLGLGNSATLDVGTTAGTVTAGDDPRLSAAAGPAGGVLAGTYPNPSFAADMATQAELDAHTGSATAHTAANIVNVAAGNIAATTVQAALNELDTEKAVDSAVVHNTGTESVAGAKNFTTSLQTPNLGAGVAPSTSAGITSAPTYTSFAGANKFGINAAPTINMAANEATFGIKGVQCQVQKAGAGNLTSTRGFVGLNLLADNSGTGNISEAIGGYFQVRNLNATAVINVGYGNLIETPTTTGAILSSQGIRIENQATASITTAFGMLVKAQTGATTNIGVGIEAAATRTLHISSNADNTAATAGIFFGSSADTNLYRSAANELKTDDAFVVGGASVTVGTNPADSGGVRLPNNTSIISRNAANTGNVTIARVGSTNVAIFGESAASIQFSAQTLFTTASAGVFNTLLVRNTQAAAAATGTGIALSGTTGGQTMAQIQSAWDGAATTDSNLAFYVRSGNNANAAVATFASTLDLTLYGNVTMTDAKNFVVGSTTGTKIGTATTQKLGFWNATPVVQPTTAVTAAAFVANTSGIANDTATFGGYTIGQIVAALKAIGVLA